MNDFLNERNVADQLKAKFAAIEQEGKRRVRQEKRTETEATIEKVFNEQTRIASVIKGLYEAVEANPDFSPSTLLADYVINHPAGLFSSKVVQNFESALNAYSEKRRTLKQYADELKHPEDFFKKCFGALPKGKVEIIQGKMTICFRCFNEDDYIYAFTHSKQPIPQGLPEEIGRAKLSGGAALSSVKIPGLAGMVILEKASNNQEKREIYTKVVFAFTGASKNAWQKFPYPRKEDADLFYLNVPGAGEYSIHIMQRDESGKPLRVSIFDHAGSNVHERDFSLKKDQQAANGITISIPSKTKYAKQEYIAVVIETDGLQIYDHSRQDVTLETARKEKQEMVIKNKEISRQIRLHEEQHQFNRLFMPSEELSPVEVKDFQKLFKRQWEDAPAARRLIIKKLATHYRQYYIDCKARDEIISYYRDGRHRDKILAILQNDELYNYKDQNIVYNGKDEASRKKVISANIWYGLEGVNEKGQLRVFKTEKPDNEGEHNWWEMRGFNWHSKEKFTRNEVEEVVDETLGYRYLRALELWIKQIEKLEELGYNRKQILGYLGMLPANQWRAFVARLQEKVKPRERKITKKA